MDIRLGFSVNAIVSMGRKAMERQGGKVSQNVLLNNVFESASGSGGQQLQCSGKPVCGESIMWNHHESNRGKVG